jgi:hypothetical protein
METITKETTTTLKGWKHELAISQLKEVFTKNLSQKLQLFKVEAPLIVEKGTGINDDLNGIESPVCVKVKNLPGIEVEIVHSLAKWKRLKLGELSVDPGYGLYTDMKALRPDEDFSFVHSIFVDQWDWEKVILKEAIYKLDEVIVTKRKQDKEFKIGGAEKIHHKQLSGDKPWVYGKLFEYDSIYKATPYLKKIVFFSDSEKKGAKLKIRIFQFNNSIPTIDLLDLHY